MTKPDRQISYFEDGGLWSADDMSPTTNPAGWYVRPRGTATTWIGPYETEAEAQSAPVGGDPFAAARKRLEEWNRRRDAAPDLPLFAPAPKPRPAPETAPAPTAEPPTPAASEPEPNVEPAPRRARKAETDDELKARQIPFPFDEPPAHTPEAPGPKPRRPRRPRRAEDDGEQIDLPF